MTDLIKGTILLLNHLDELKGSDRWIVLRTLDENLLGLMSALSELVIGSVDNDFERTGKMDEILSEDASVVVKESIDLCYDETRGTSLRGGTVLAAMNIERYCDENYLCSACFGELHSEDFLTCGDIEEYQGRKVTRVTNCGFVCPHCGFREEW